MSMEEAMKDLAGAMRELASAMRSNTNTPQEAAPPKPQDAPEPAKPARTEPTAEKPDAPEPKEKHSEPDAESVSLPEGFIFGDGKKGEVSLSRMFLDAVTLEKDGKRLGAPGVIAMLAPAGITAKLGEIKDKPEAWPIAYKILRDYLGA